MKLYLFFFFKKDFSNYRFVNNTKHNDPEPLQYLFTTVIYTHLLKFKPLFFCFYCVPAVNRVNAIGVPGPPLVFV